jgi:hypothetical protein
MGQKRRFECRPMTFQSSRRGTFSVSVAKRFSWALKRILQNGVCRSRSSTMSAPIANGLTVRPERKSGYEPKVIKHRTEITW